MKSSQSFTSSRFVTKLDIINPTSNNNQAGAASMICEMTSGGVSSMPAMAGMLLTPPDVISQIMLAAPAWLLFEVGLIMSSFVTKRDEVKD